MIKLIRLAHRSPGSVARAAATPLLLLTLAACANPPVQADHGRVVAHLPIPFTPAGQPEVIRVTISPGQRFSIKIDTSDGPYAWLQVSGPDPRLIGFAGDFNDGSCPSGMVGCRVPYFHTMITEHRGATTATWRYRDYACPATPTPTTTASPAETATPAIPCQPAEVTLKITVG